MDKNQFNGVFGVYGSCRACAVGKACLLQGIPDKEIDHFEHIVERKLVLKKGAHLFEQGQSLSSIYVLQSGSLKGYCNSYYETEQITSLYYPKDIVGMSAIVNEVHPDSVIALETSTLCELPYHEMTELCQRLPRLQQNLIKLFSKEVNKVQQSRAFLRNKSADARYAAYLWSIYERMEPSADQKVELKMPRSDIAGYLNLTPETLCRVSGRLQQEGLISVNQDKVRFNDIKALKRLAGVKSIKPLASDKSSQDIGQISSGL